MNQVIQAPFKSSSCEKLTIFDRLEKFSVRSVAHKHLAYFLAGWISLVFPRYRISERLADNSWLRLLDIAGAKFWPLVFLVFTLGCVGLLLVVSQVVSSMQPLLTAAGTWSAIVWVWFVFFICSVWRYFKGRGYLKCYVQVFKN